MLSLRLEFSEDMVGDAKPFPECQVASQRLGIPVVA